jgi:Nif-specific regulatory protein
MRACLTIEAGEGTPRMCELPTGQAVTLGRNRGNSIVLQDKHASRWHAEIYCHDGRWYLRDCGTLNGTKLDGERIRQPTRLCDGHTIGIGDTRLRITLDDSAKVNGASAKAPATSPRTPPPSLGEPTATVLLADELTSLCHFMSQSVGETSFEELVALALATVHRQTSATITGFLSLDAENPVPKMVLPEMASVDVHLSRQLTQKVQCEGQPVWLSAHADEAMQSDSLLSFRDAICLPLRTGGEPFGALHVYRTCSNFTERDFAFCRVLAGYLASSLQVLRSRRQLEAENSRLRGHAPADEEIVGDSPAMQRLRQHITRLAPKPCSVLITGESGAGKELVALALHRESTRADGPLVPVNCAAITATLPEAELFGHCKGSFTGADQDHPGLFQQAHEGTLFLDEIGDLSMECQAKLLRALESGRIRPVGGREEIEVNVRILAASNRDLDQMVRDGRFRNDLFFRLAVPIHVPPLRDHAEDIPALVEHFLPRIVREYHRLVRLSRTALIRLAAYSWPGNVRQLRSVLELAVAMSDADTIEESDLRLPGLAPATQEGPPSLELEAMEAWTIRKAMRQTKGNAAAAAKVLGIHRDTLAAKLKKYGIDKEDFA